MADAQPSQVLRFDALDPAKRHEVVFHLSAAGRAVYPWKDLVGEGHWFCVRRNGRIEYTTLQQAVAKAQVKYGVRLSIRTNEFEGKIYVVRTG